MKILGINSSARKDGNTAILMEKAFEALHKEGIETEMIQLSGKIIEPCKACFACDGQRNCVHKKDQFQDIFEKMTQADGIILGSPVYTANISANMQALLERASVVTDMNRKEKLFRHKPGAAITAARRGTKMITRVTTPDWMSFKPVCSGSKSNMGRKSQMNEYGLRADICRKSIILR